MAIVLLSENCPHSVDQTNTSVKFTSLVSISWSLKGNILWLCLHLSPPCEQSRFDLSQISLFPDLSRKDLSDSTRRVSLPKKASTVLPTCGCLVPKGSTDKPNVWTALVIQPSLTVLPSASKCLCCDWVVLSQLAVPKPWDITRWCELGNVSFDMYWGDSLRG